MMRHESWVPLLLVMLGAAACATPDADKVKASLESHGAATSLVAASRDHHATGRGYTRVTLDALRKLVSQDSADAMGKNVAPDQRSTLVARAESLATVLDSLRDEVRHSR